MKFCKVKMFQVLIFVCSLSVLSTQSEGNEKGSLFSFTDGKTEITDVEKQKLETALKASSWESIAGIMKEVKKKNGDTCNLNIQYRFIAALSFLATGGDNEAALLFYCPGNDDSSTTYTEWKKWTDLFLKRNPKVPMAQFLSGDAYARNKEFDKANEVLKRLVESKECPESIKYMAYNSLGVVAWIMKEKRASINYFQMAGQREKFADPLVNLGILMLQGGAGEEEFEEAIKINPENGMARIGKSFAQTFRGDSYKEIKKTLKEVDEQLITSVTNNESLKDADIKLTQSRKGQYHLTERFGDNYRNIDSTFQKDQVQMGGWYGLGGGQISISSEMGGVDSRMIEGENLTTVKEGDKKNKLGIWFTLNYPMP